jgi:PAS domain S-box-containing protein
MMAANELESLRREVETLRTRVADLQREAARYRETDEHTSVGGLDVSVSEREELLVEVERLAHMGSWIWNLETQQVVWSPELYRILGYDPEKREASTEAFFAAVHPDDRTRIQEVSAKGVAAGIAPQVDYRVLRADGTVRYVTMAGTMLFDDAGNLRRIVGAVLDLTEQRESAERSKRDNERLEEAQSIAHLASWQVELETGTFTWSGEFYRILGLPLDTQASQERFNESLHPDDRQRMADTHRRVLETGEGATADGRILRPDGELRYVRIKGVVHRNSQGKLEALRGTMLDITEHVRFREHLAHIQKMEAVGRLAGGIAHDFNNVLTVITTNLDLLRMSMKSSCPEIEESFQALASATALTQRLLAFGRKAQLQRTVADANLLVSSTMVLMRRLVGDEIALHLELAEDLPSIRVDTTQLERALMNLVVNARDALPPGGQVTIATRAIKADGTRWVEISVADNGPGIDEETRTKVFEPFFTTKHDGRGTGLGLATVLGTAEQHGGTVDVDDRAEGGTIFRLRLPADGGAVSAENNSTAEPRSLASNSGKTVFLVEDDPMVASVVVRTLEAGGHRVVLAAGPSEALRLWREQPGAFDLVICDVVMAEMRGPELARKLADGLHATPVLFITGYSEEMVTDNLEHPVLGKPFSAAELNNAVARLL